MSRRNLQNVVRRFLLEENGPTATEYAVMLALIIVVALASITSFGNTLGSEYSNINTTLFPS